jgi:hypothetical protein
MTGRSSEDTLMSSSHDRIKWREPFGARVRLGLAMFRGKWLLSVGAGAGTAILGLVLLAVWAHSLSEPFNLRAAALICAMGLLIIFLLEFDNFIRRTIWLGEQEIRIAQPDRPQRIPYESLRVCV